MTMRFLSLVGNSFGCSASGERLVSAARDGDLQEAKALLDYNPRLIRYSTFGVRNSPLHYSAAQGHHEVLWFMFIIETRYVVLSDYIDNFTESPFEFCWMIIDNFYFIF